jgi:hypothetical protein
VQIHTFVADFSQNMGVPNLAGEQPGKAYDLSPLSAFVFGVVDCSNKKARDIIESSKSFGPFDLWIFGCFEDPFELKKLLFKEFLVPDSS